MSDTPGTTTDVNEKSMELLPVGPVTLIDTAGFDDVGEIGRLRVQKTMAALNRVDVAVVVFDNNPPDSSEIEFLETLKGLNISVLAVLNKTDINLMDNDSIKTIEKLSSGILKVSCANDNDIPAKFKEALVKILPDEFISVQSSISGLLSSGDTAVLVIPIDKEAPKGRLILPQVNVLRDILDAGASGLVVRDIELKEALEKLKNPPDIVICDSQVFKKVNEIVPDNILMTSFSVLFARLKGDLKTFIDGAEAILNLKDNDFVLILESCSHHPVEDDIGRVKIPDLIRKFTGKNILFEHYSGHDFPPCVKKYSLIIHCGACMTNRREILNRIRISLENNVPITNYGIAIAKCLNILDRAIKLFDI